MDFSAGVDEGGFLRRLAGGEAQFFAALQGHFAAGGLQTDEAVNQREVLGGISVGNLEQKFRAANGPGGERGVEFHVRRFFAVEKIKRAGRKAEAFFLGAARRENFQRGAFVEADDTAVGKLHGRAALGARAEAVAGMQLQTDDGRLPVGFCAAEKFHLSGGFEQDAGGIAGLRGGIEKAQHDQGEGEKNSPHARKVVGT